MKLICFTLSILIISLSLILSAQDNYPDRVPKQYSVELGYSYAPRSDFEHLAGNGITLGFDYAWQLSGINGKKPAVFLSIPLSYTYLFATQPGDSSASMLTYGWRVRHQLSKGKTVTPYLGYYLLLNQLKIFEHEGSAMGHQTKFEFGLNFNSQKTFPFMQLDYSMTRFPSLDTKKSKWIHSLGIRSGVRF
jgi:hypothetical protein